MALSTPMQQRPASMAVRASPVRASQANSQAELDDHYLVALAKDGKTDAYDAIIRRYRGFVRLKASSYFLLGGESDDLIQEGLLGLYKAIRDYRTDRESSFRNFAELCITRQIITAVKTATRNKHTPLNQYVSFSQTPAAAGDSDTTLDEILPGPSVHDPVNQVIATEELRASSPASPASPASSPTSRAASSRSTSTATPTRRSPSGWSATPRPSTTPCSGSSARSAAHLASREVAA